MKSTKINNYHFDWSELAFQSKKPLSSLKATFITAPRAISPQRFTQLIKTYLPKGNIILGIAREPYVLGFEDQPQFTMLTIDTVQPIIKKVNDSASPHKVYVLFYSQRDLKYMFEKIDFRRVVLINGSWKYSFHTQAPYYVLVNRGLPYEMVSPFIDEQEACDYAEHSMPKVKSFVDLPPIGSVLSEEDMLKTATQSALQSFDYSFQTGVALGKKATDGYTLRATSFNKVVPFQTFAMHYGASRERHFSPPHDLNHYDTVHAEVEMIIHAGKEKLDLHGTTLFINLLPCPSCARMFTETDINEFIYSVDHSDGYALKLLERAGKKVTRIV